MVGDKDDIFIIGGAQIYKETMQKGLADQLDVTLVDQEFEADVFFPEIDLSVWKETNREDLKADDKNKYDFSFVSYTKKTI